MYIIVCVYIVKVSLYSLAHVSDRWRLYYIIWDLKTILCPPLEPNVYTLHTYTHGNVIKYVVRISLLLVWWANKFSTGFHNALRATHFCSSTYNITHVRLYVYSVLYVYTCMWCVRMLSTRSSSRNYYYHYRGIRDTRTGIGCPESLKMHSL